MPTSFVRKHNTVCRKATSFYVRKQIMMLTYGQMMLRVNSQTMLCPAGTNTKRKSKSEDLLFLFGRGSRT